MAGWLLGVDFGTSNTAAAHVNEMTGVVQALPLSHNSNLMSSSVYVQSLSQIDVGEVALNKAAGDPGGFIAAPKRLLSLGQTVFEVAAGEIPAHLVIAAILRSVLVRGQSQHGGLLPSGLALTHPEGWSSQQVRVLVDAAAAVGYSGSAVHTVSEPRAAVAYYARGGQVAPGDRVGVFDFGGGTLDVAVLAAAANGSFGVVAAQGDNALGGRNFDAAIRRWVDNQLCDRDPTLLTALDRGMSFRDLRGLDESIRAGKEVLSEAPQAGIDVAAGGQHEMLLLTRGEFEGLIEREVARGVELARSTFRMAGVSGSDVRAIYLTGGSSRIPLVHQHVSALGSVATLDDPKTVVAQGAVTFTMGQGLAHPAPMSQPVSQPVPPPISPPMFQQGAQFGDPTVRPPAPPSAPRRSRGKLIGAAVAAVVVVVAVVVVIVASSGGKNANGGSTANAAAGGSSAVATTSAAPDPTTVLSAMPAQLRQAISCSPSSAPKTEDQSIDLSCQFDAGNSLTVGLFKPGMDLLLDASLVTNPTKFVDETRNDLAGGRIVTDDGSVFVTYGVLVSDSLGYLNVGSGLELSLDRFTSQQAAQTFMTRAGL